MSCIQNMHPIWAYLVYRTQWQLGVINHVCLNYPRIAAPSPTPHLTFLLDPFKPLIMQRSTPAKYEEIALHCLSSVRRNIVHLQSNLCIIICNYEPSAQLASLFSACI